MDILSDDKKGYLPIWGLVKYKGVKLSPVKTYSDMVVEGVLLTVEIYDNELLKSDFDLWSAVLVNAYIPPADNPDINTDDTSQIELEKAGNGSLI
jgi:hypothetical protein